MSQCGPDQVIRILHYCTKASLLALSLIAAFVHALPDDRDQPIHITADKALRDEKKGVTIYTGNVQLVQGSMELDADSLTILNTSDAAEEIIAEGNPAKMRQRPEPDEGIVHAHARVITYYQSEDRVHLKTEARIEQDGAVVAGDSIDYFITEQVITAESDQSQKDNKVVVVIPPSVQKEGEGTTPEVSLPEEETDPPATGQPEEGDSGATESE